MCVCLSMWAFGGRSAWVLQVGRSCAFCILLPLCCLSVAFLCTLPLETRDDANILGSCAKILQLLFGDATKAFDPQD